METTTMGLYKGLGFGVEGLGFRGTGGGWVCCNRSEFGAFFEF